MQDGQANGVAFAIGGAVLTAILVLKRFRRLPMILIAVVAATVVVGSLDLANTAGVSILGPLPQGLPAFEIPWIGVADLGAIVIGGCAVALVAFADTSVLSRTYAARTKTSVDPNQEMIALGGANLAAGFFQGFPISSSSSRTPVAEAAGARTQLTGVVGALAVALLLVAAPDLLRNLPNSALAAVVIASAIGLFEFGDLGRIWRIQRWEFWLSMVCFAGVAAFGAIPGIGLAVVIAVIEFLWDGWRPHSAVLGRVDGIRGFHDVSRYPQARLVPGLLLFRWDAPLFFANAELFQQRVLQTVAEAPAPVRRVVVTAEPVTSIDVTSADMLAELERALREASIELHFAEMKDPVKDKLRQVRAVRAFRQRPIPPDRRCFRRCLPSRPCDRLGLLIRQSKKEYGPWGDLPYERDCDWERRGLLHRRDVLELPALIEERLCGTVEAKDRKPPLAGHGLDPVAVVLRHQWTKENID